MTPLFRAWPALSRRLAFARARLYLFDVDGTLAPIAPSPEKARVPRSTIAKLQKLTRQPGTTVGFISGRSLSGLQRMLRIPRAIYSGNHGLEARGPGLKFVHKRANQQARSFVRLLPRLRAVCRDLPGTRIENKGLTISIHYRGVRLSSTSQITSLKQKISTLTQNFGLSMHRGKKVVEIRPSVNWDKGAAMGLIRRRLPSRPIVLFAGDDATDEAVFGRLRKEDIGVRVGASVQSKARYYLKEQSQVDRLLGSLLILRSLRSSL